MNREQYLQYRTSPGHQGYVVYAFYKEKCTNCLSFDQMLLAMQHLHLEIQGEMIRRAVQYFDHKFSIVTITDINTKQIISTR